MPNATLKPLDPNLRQQIAQMLSGDAKAGSIRAHLVHGLMGSQTGEDSGLVGMTPLGAVFDASAAERDQRQGGTGLGHTLSAAAGLIPGAGPEIKAGSAAAHNIASDLVWALAHKAGLLDVEGAVKNPTVEKSLYDLATKHGEDPRYLSDDGLDELSEALMKQHSGQELLDLQKQHGITPQDIVNSHNVTGVRNTRAQADAAYDQSRQPKVSGIRAQLEAASKNDAKGATVVDAKSPPSVAGTRTALSDATKPQKVTPASVDDEAEYERGDIPAGRVRQGYSDEASTPHGDSTEAVNLLAKHNPDRLNQILMDYAPGAEDKDHLIQLLNEGLSPEEHSSLLDEARKSIPKTRPTQ